MIEVIAHAKRKHAEFYVQILRMLWLFLLTTGAAYSPSPTMGGNSGSRRGVVEQFDTPLQHRVPEDGRSIPAEEREVVFLLHGICKSNLDMVFLAQTLRREGYEVVNWNYPSRQLTLDQLADLLSEMLEPYQGRRVNFVTHSMGGIVVRTFISKHNPTNLGRLVMIAPPNQGAVLADLLGDWMIYRLVFGPAGQQLRQGEAGSCAQAGIPTCEFGVIAGGNGKPYGMNPIIPGDNDGTVSVECTKLEGMRDFVVVPYGHTYIQFMPRTVENTLHFLRRGHFAENCPDRPKADSSREAASADVD